MGTCDNVLGVFGMTLLIVSTFSRKWKICLQLRIKIGKERVEVREEKSE